MASVQVYETKQTIPTFELLEDNINPIFDKRLDPYPYTLQNYRSKQKTNKSYDVVVLENEYLKLTFIPSLGGRLYSAFDKRNNQDFLYKNQVIQPRMIGTRGAWFSGGIEFNFPISHAPTTMDRVNYTIQNGEDGSASIVFGNIEQISYMNWKVEIKLYPGKISIEQNVHLYNPTSRENRFYFWTNTAVEYNKSLKLIYPFDWGINAADGKYIKWPYYKNIDYRQASQIPSSYETFGKLMNDDSFGIYNYDKDYGLVHYANRKKVKGAKFFIWGNDANAESWNRQLTDDDSEYIEVQSGPFESQMVFKFLKPHQELSWSEYWYPIVQTNGFKYASKEIAVNYEISEQGIEFIFAATENLDHCRIVLDVGGKQYVEQRNLSPKNLEKIHFPLTDTKQKHLFKLNVYHGMDHLLEIGTRDEFSPEYPDHDLYEDSRTSFGAEDRLKTLKQAQWQESLGMTAQAIVLYLSNLQENPYCTTSLNRLGMIYLKNMQLSEAKVCFEKVLRYDNRNSEARFNFATVLKESGDLVGARRFYMDIAADAEYYEASVMELIKLDIALGYFKEAQTLIESFDFAKNYRYFLGSIAYRQGNQKQKSAELLRQRGQTDEYLSAEAFRVEGTDQAADSFVAYTEGDEQVILPIVLDYVEMRLYSDAYAMLQLIKNPSLKSQLVILYIKQQTQAGFKLTRADLQQPLDHVFVNEPQIVKIVSEFTVEDESGKLDYLLGTYYYSACRKEEALEYFLSAFHKGLRFTALLRNLGYLYDNVKQDLESATHYYELDMQVNGGINEECLNSLDRIYREQSNLDKRRSLLPYLEKARNKSLVLLTLVDIYKDLDEDEKAMAILENEEFENWENKEHSGPRYREMIMHIAMKEFERGRYEAAQDWMERVRQYPSNLNYGETAGTSMSEVHYRHGLIYSKLGKEALAIKHFKEGYMEMEHDGIHKTDNSTKYSMRCLQELQKRESYV